MLFSHFSIGYSTVFSASANAKDFLCTKITKHRLCSLGRSSRAENNGLASLNLNSCVADKSLHTVIIGVVATKSSVTVYNSIYCTNVFYALVYLVKVGNYSLLVWKSYVYAKKILGPHKAVKLLGSYLVGLVFIVSKHAVNDLGVAVSQLFANKSVFHILFPSHKVVCTVSYGKHI